ncbi:hypothetical protein O181_008353 [Austropuccinia psidii MF-1]|uniref:Uncharacterized protein n=1 Tax=Austropuccinia psidii MF-1 TaxID=1389203 RepID=A0A9Q3GIF3_9BASI|nr:hypothetical protein [Austropuccinia psidii MF-1]
MFFTFWTLRSQANTPVPPSEPEGSKGKGKRRSEGLITEKKWTPIATQRNRKLQNSASIQGKPTLTACTGKITIGNPVVTSKGKLPKSADNKFVQDTVKETLASKGTNQRTEKACSEPEDLEEDTLETEVNQTHTAIHIPIQQKPQTRGLERYGSSSSAPPTPQTFLSMEHGEQEVQPGISLGRTWSKLVEDLSQRDRVQRPYGNYQRLESHPTVQTPGGEGKQDKGESSHYPSYRRTTKPDRAYSDSFRLTSSRPTQCSSGFTPIRHQQISGRESPFFTIPGSFQEKKRIQGQKKDHLQTNEERVQPNDPEADRFGERSAQEPEVAVHNSRISIPINRNITPTQIENNVVTPESNINSDSLWLQMSQYAEKTQEQFAELEASHERIKTLTAPMDKIVKTLQEGHAQLSIASEETKKRLNLVFEEQHHSQRDRDCLDQDINKLFNVYHHIKPQPQGHVMDNPYHQDDIKPDAMLMNKARSPSQYQDGDNMSYSEKEELKQLPEASSWPKVSRTGEYDYIHGLFIAVPSIPGYWITDRLNTALKGHAIIWYTEMKEIHGRQNWPWLKIQIIQKYRNGTWICQKTTHLKMTSIQWTKIHMNGVLDNLKDLKPLIPK